MIKKINSLVLLFILITSISAYAHSGRTDSQGGHYDKSTGIYHYHNKIETNNNSDSNSKRNFVQEFLDSEDEREIARLENHVSRLKIEKESIEEEYRKYYSLYINQEKALKQTSQAVLVLIAIFIIETIYIIYKKVKK